MTTYLVPAGYGQAELVEKRSRFIGHVWRTDSEEEALGRLAQMRSEHRDATHNVYAYIVRENNITRYSDDGEPGGTSGLPTLNVFASEGIENVCCVITRYFGGTLLGAGGLVRAYSKAAKMALDAAGVAQMAQWRRLLVGCDYGFYERAKRILEEHEAQLRGSDFGTEVALELLVRQDMAQALEAKLRDAANGKIFVETGDDEFLGVKIR